MARLTATRTDWLFVVAVAWTLFLAAALLYIIFVK